LTGILRNSENAIIIFHFNNYITQAKLKAGVLHSNARIVSFCPVLVTGDVAISG
jgi:hypothetical protein